MCLATPTKIGPIRTIYHAELQRLVPPMADMGVPGKRGRQLPSCLKSAVITRSIWASGTWARRKGCGPRIRASTRASVSCRVQASTLNPVPRSTRELPGDPLDRLLWAGADRRRSVQRKQAVSRRQVHDRLSERSGGSGHQGQSKPALLHLSGLQCSAHAVSGDEGGL